MGDRLSVCTVVGARPQFVKAAALSRAFRSYNARHTNLTFDEKIVHTGQHYDEAMSDVFFRELEIAAPWRNLEVGSGTHGQQTAQIMERFEACLLEAPCSLVVVFGDTNSTIAAALVAAKLHVPVAHVEAGLRSFNRRMPEEVNRVVTDHVADLHFCPSNVAADHLRREGISSNVFVCGDIMRDALCNVAETAESGGSSSVNAVVSQLGSFAVATVHRAENTDDPARLSAIMNALESLPVPVILPLHPRTKGKLAEHGISTGRIHTTEPLSYGQMVSLQKNARLVLTDSGGIQKEAYWLKVPCVTMRDETEWTELVDAGANIVAGAQKERIALAAETFLSQDFAFPDDESIYGRIGASERIVDELARWCLVESSVGHHDPMPISHA